MILIRLEDDEVDPDELTMNQLLDFMDGADVYRVIHARDLTDAEKRQARKRSR